MPARLAPDQSRGYLIPIGIATRPEAQRDIYRRLVGMLGQRPHIVLISAQGPDETQGDDVEATLVSLGAGQVHRVLLATRGDGDQAAALSLVERTDLVLLSADQPLRLSTLLGGTQLARLIRRRNADGMAVAGVGGGAALLCEHMLAHGTEGPTPRLGGASLAPGLGLTNRVVIDQGGHATDRLGRLLAALALNPFALGLGVDPDTAAVIGPDNALEVIGAGGVTVIDPAEMADSNAADLAPGAPIRITNLRLHSLTGGTRYDLDFRRTLA